MIKGNENVGIIYVKTGQFARGEVSSYHGKPSPLEKHVTRWKVDVNGLKKREMKNILHSHDFSVIHSKFTIGFEIEKNNLHRDSIEEYELFCGFERDSSCGYEAVTHILPLLPPSQWRTKVFYMMHKAEYIIDDAYSPSDERFDGQYRCGGHINIACHGMEGRVLKDTIRPYSGILLALFRYRLKNNYCGHNRRMEDYGKNWDDMYDSCRYGYPATDNGWHNKYQMCLVKDNIVEWRLPSRVESVHQLMRRYEIMYELMDFSVNVKGTLSALFKRIRPIVLSMYDGNENECDKVMVLAKRFQIFINTGKRHADIKKYL